METKRERLCRRGDRLQGRTKKGNVEVEVNGEGKAKEAEMKLIRKCRKCT